MPGLRSCTTHCLCKFIKDRFSSRFRFTGKAAAKVRTFSINFQIFSKLFSKFFFRGETRTGKAGKRGKPPLKYTGSVSVSVRQSFNQHRFVPESGCKSRDFTGHGKI